MYKEVDGEELALLPRPDERNMMRVTFGHRYRRAAIEVSYERVRHHGSFADFPVETTFQAVNVDGRLFKWPASSVAVLIGRLAVDLFYLCR